MVQVSVFVENKPGKLNRVTGILANRGINIRAITIADSGEFGIIKLLVDSPDDAYQALKENGMVVYLKDIVAIEIEDKPGGLHRVTEILDRNNINVEDAYGFVIEDGKKAVFVFQVEDPQEVEGILKNNGVRVLKEGDIFLL